MKTLFSDWRRGRGIAARRSAGVAVLRATAFAAAAAGLTGVASADPEPKLPSDYAKSQPQKSVAEAMNKHRPEWKHFVGAGYDFYDYDYYSITKHERFRQLRKLDAAGQQRALAQLSGELYAGLPIARARIEDQTYRNLGYLLRPDGVFAGAGVAPLVGGGIGVGAGPAPIGGIGFDASAFGPGVPAAGGCSSGQCGSGYGGGVYGGGFAPGMASDGLSVARPMPGYGAPVYDPHGQGYGPSPDPAFAGTPVPAGSYLTPDGRLVGPDGQPVRPGGAGSVSGAVGPNGQPMRPNGPDFGDQHGPGLNAPGVDGSLNGRGTPIPSGSTFGPNGEVIGPNGRVLNDNGDGVRPVSAEFVSYGGPVGGPAYGGPAYGGSVMSGPLGSPGLIGPGYGGPAYGGGCADGQCGPISSCGPAGCGPVGCGPVGCGPVGNACGSCAPVHAGWITGHYVNGDLDGTECRSGFDYDIGGLNAGIARLVSPTLLVGGFVGYSSVDAESNYYDLGNYNVDTFQFGGYARKLIGNFYLIGAATAGIDDYDVHRNVDYPDFVQRPATANFNGATASVFGELGYTKAITCSHFFQPFVSLQYTHVMRSGFQEEGEFSKDRYNDYFDTATGTNKAYKFASKGDDYGSNLSVTGTEDDFLRTRVGARFFRRLRNCEATYRVLPELRAYWAHEEYDPSSFTARMNDMHDCPFVVAGLEDVSDAAVLGGGLTFAHCCGLSLYGNVDTFLADRDTATAVSGGTQFVW